MTHINLRLDIADDLLNKKAEIAIFDPKESKEKILADFDYLNKHSE